MRKQQREITNHQRKFQNNAINDVKQISLSHVIKLRTGFKLPANWCIYIKTKDFGSIFHSPFNVEHM